MLKSTHLTIGILIFLFCHSVNPPVRAKDSDSVARDIIQVYRSGDTDKAIKQLSDLMSKDKSNISLLNLRAEMYQQDSQFQKAVGDLDKLIKENGRRSEWWHKRGVCYFNLGEFQKSVADFDTYLKKNPEREPHHWQRGISHYYAKMYKQGRKQFEDHQYVNSQDVENAVWHFLCVTKVSSVEEAKKNWIPIQRDSRLPLMKVQDLFLGKATVEDVIKTAKLNAKSISAERLKMQNFYGHLYIALYYEATNKPELAQKHMKLAAEKYFVEGYMGNVAKVHYKQFLKTKKAATSN